MEIMSLTFSLKRGDSYDLFKKETFGKNIYNDYVNGMSIFPMKVKTGEEKCPKWLDRDCVGKCTHLKYFCG